MNYGPVSSLEGAAAFGVAQVQVRATAACLVDWWAQRLERGWTAAAQTVAMWAAPRLAEVVVAITQAPAEVLDEVVRPQNQVAMLASHPIPVGPGPTWTERPASVAYRGGHSDQKGAVVLVGVARLLGAHGVAVNIVGGGRAAPRVEAAHSPTRRFRGAVDDVRSPARSLHGFRVGGAAHYHTHFPMHAYSDPLKIKDYLAVGMSLVSGLSSNVDDGVDGGTGRSVAEMVGATWVALSEPTRFEPSEHPLLVGAGQSLQALVVAVEASL